MNILVFGCRKTGTTVVAETIHRSIENATFVMEPRSVDAFVPSDQDQVVKVLYEDAVAGQFVDKLVANDMPIKFDKMIKLVRDPRDQLISDLYYDVFDAITLRHLNPITFTSWMKMVDRKFKKPESISVEQMVETVQQVLKSPITLDRSNIFDIVQHEMPFTLRYEDWIDSKTSSLEQYLGVALDDRRMISEGHRRVRRTEQYGDWKTHFLPSDIELYQKLHGDKMAALGYDDWTTDNAPEVQAKHRLKYVMDLVLAGNKENSEKMLTKT